MISQPERKGVTNPVLVWRGIIYYDGRMLLLIHILSASVSLIFSTFGLFFPSRRKLNISYIFIASTFVTGTLLIFADNVSLAHVCMSGLTYLAIAPTEAYITRKRLSPSATE